MGGPLTLLSGFWIRVRKNYDYILLFSIVFSVELCLWFFFSTDWEWDVKSRAEIGENIARNGLDWYFDQNPYVWLPFFHILTGLLIFLTGLSGVTCGAIISAFSSGMTCVYVYRYLQKIFGLESEKCFIGGFLVPLSGYWLSYGSQGMTDIFSVFLFTVTLYHLHKFLESNSRKDLAIASLASLLNVMTRYEAWLFLIIFTLAVIYLKLLRTEQFLKQLINLLIFIIPSVVFISSWLLYNHACCGDYFGFRTWVFENNHHASWSYYHDVKNTIGKSVLNLFLALGLLWVTIPGLLFHLKYFEQSQVKLFTILVSLLFFTYLFYYLYSMYQGYNSGWRRHLLYFVPLSAISTVLFASFTNNKKLLIFIIGVSAIIGQISFAINYGKHLK